jgi:hypothetical protein
MRGTLGLARPVPTLERSYILRGCNRRGLEEVAAPNHSAHAISAEKFERRAWRREGNWDPTFSA